MLDFQGRTALVTGASRGIGAAVAQVLGRRGARVCVTYQGNRQAAEELCQGLGNESFALQLDVADTEACTRAVDAAVERMGKLDVLVNNAGIAVDGLLMRMKDSDWDRVLDTNLRGAFAMCRAAARPMMKARAGSVVNVSSIIGEMGNGGQVAYAASKAGLLGLTKSMARELASRNIRVNAVTPGFIETDMTAGLDEALREKMKAQIPLARLGSAQDVAQAVAFLASDAAAFITGEVLKVNGGMYM